MKLQQLDRRFLGRESEPEDVQVARTQGCYVYDARGKRYIDFLSGWCVGNFGWARPGLRSRVHRFAGPEGSPPLRPIGFGRVNRCGVVINQGQSDDGEAN